MNFCEKCNFMLYIKISDENVLSFECKQCGHQTEFDSSKTNHCIYSKDYTTDKISYSWMVNKDLCSDPTLPRVNNIPCPNHDIDDKGQPVCPTKSKMNPKSNEVIYVLFDKKELKYFYMCCHCYTAWKHE